MKVLQINNVHYRRGGADAVYLNTADLLMKHGNDVVFFNMRKDNNLPCKDEKYWVSSIESRPKGIKSTLLELRNFFCNPEAAETRYCPYSFILGVWHLSFYYKSVEKVPNPISTDGT